MRILLKPAETRGDPGRTITIYKNQCVAGKFGKIRPHGTALGCKRFSQTGFALDLRDAYLSGSRVVATLEATNWSPLRQGHDIVRCAGAVGPHRAPNKVSTESDGKDRCPVPDEAYPMGNDGDQFHARVSAVEAEHKSKTIEPPPSSSVT